MKDNFCPKCKVTVVGQDKCPLCGRYIGNEDALPDSRTGVVDLSYPVVNPEIIIKKIMLKIAIFLCIASSSITLIIDGLFTAKLDWGLHVTVAWGLFWVTLGRSVFFRMHIKKQIVWDSVFACFLCFYIQYMLSDSVLGWAFQFAMPTILSASTIMLCALMIMRYSAWQEYALPTTALCILCVIPLIAVLIAFQGKAYWTFYVAAGIGAITLLGMSILGNQQYFMQLKKLFHI